MERLTLNLPDGLLEAVMRLSGSTGKTETLVAALRAYETELRLKRLQNLRGSAPLPGPHARGEPT